MKKQIRLKSAALSSILVLSGLCLKGADGIKDITKPYLGVYECKEIYFGEKEYTDCFDYVTIELKPKGELVLSYREKGGREGKADAEYTYNTKEDVLTVSAKLLGERRIKSFPVKKGEMDLSFRYSGKMLRMKFIQK